MKNRTFKSILNISIIIGLLSVFCLQSGAKEVSGYSFEVNTYYKWEPTFWDYTRVCRYDECTDNSGNTCDQSGAAFRSCKPLIWI